MRVGVDLIPGLRAHPLDPENPVANSPLFPPHPIRWRAVTHSPASLCAYFNRRLSVYDASRAKLVAIGKPFDRLEFDTCRVGNE
jgi:hypothetical protein